MNATDPPAGSRGGKAAGLAYVLVATVVAGAIGYLIQALVPAFTDGAEYIAFSVFWSAVYLAVSAISGVQQEAARAAHVRADGEPAAWPVLLRFATLGAAVFIVVVGVTSPFWAPSVFAPDTWPLVIALLVATLGYTFIAVLSGAFYGLRDWRGAAAMTVTDAALRLIAIGSVLVAGAGTVALGWAVALPFVGAFAAVWVVAGRRVRRGIAIDTDLRGLSIHSVSTVGAALATGLMISGLPLLLGIVARGLGESTLAALILVITLTRAPLVVPLLALQSYLVVTFRDDAAAVRSQVLRWGGMLLALTAVLAAAAVVVGPWLIEWVYAGRYVLEPAAYAAIVASAGLTALLCLTGPAVLAAGRHRAYVSGWAAASLAVVVGLLLVAGVGGGVWALLIVLMASPIVGVAIHLWTLLLPTGSTRPRAQDA